MAVSTIFLSNLLSLLTGSAIIVFGFEPVVTYGKDLVNGYQKNVQMNLDFLFGGNPNDKSSDSNWIEKYCMSKVGITRLGFPCNLTMEQKHKNLPRNCVEVQSRGFHTSGLYEIQPDKNKYSFMVLCDMEIKGGGWTHIHKRFDGSVDFNLHWREYKFGFGDLNGEFWIGLENMHSLTGINRNELLVELVDRSKGYGFAQYNEFRIGSESNGYPLERLSGFSGDAGDSLNWHLGMKFTTKDVDQDLYEEDNCSNYSRKSMEDAIFTLTSYIYHALDEKQEILCIFVDLSKAFDTICHQKLLNNLLAYGLRGGAYWYNNCFASNLNGELINHEVLPSRERQGMTWDSFRSRSYVLAKARMLIRPYSPR